MLSGDEEGDVSRRKETLMNKPVITLYMNDPMGKR
jgi:hypothetical protein